VSIFVCIGLPIMSMGSGEEGKCVSWFLSFLFTVKIWIIGIFIITNRRHF
jgi:hypothetical protein